MFDMDYSALERRMMQAFPEITHEQRYVCKKRARKLKQRGREIHKDVLGYYWLRAPKVRILNSSFDKFYTSVEHVKPASKCILCDSFPQHTITGRYIVKPELPTLAIQGKSSIVLMLARQYGLPVEELKFRTDMEFSPMLEQIRHGALSLVNRGK